MIGSIWGREGYRFLGSSGDLARRLSNESVGVYDRVELFWAPVGYWFLGSWGGGA